MVKRGNQTTNAGSNSKVIFFSEISQPILAKNKKNHTFFFLSKCTRHLLHKEKRTKDVNFYGPNQCLWWKHLLLSQKCRLLSGSVCGNVFETSVCLAPAISKTKKFEPENFYDIIKKYTPVRVWQPYLTAFMWEERKTFYKCGRNVGDQTLFYPHKWGAFKK